MVLLTAAGITHARSLLSPQPRPQGITLASVALNAWEDPLKTCFLLNLLVLLTLLLGR